jgi:hypothetical protein
LGLFDIGWLRTARSTQASHRVASVKEEFMSDLKRTIVALLVISVCSAGTTAWTEDPSEENQEATEEKAQSKATEDAEEADVTIKTVEYRVPEGGYLTDPAVVQDEPRGSALNRIFPLWKSIAKGHALPRPWSVGVVSYWQTQPYDIDEASIGVGDLPPLDLDVAGTVAFIDVKSVNAKLGLWLFPFLNVTGTVGYNIIDTDIHLPNAPIGINPPPRPGEPPEITFGERTLDLDFEGPFWATSATIVGGWKGLFGSATFSYADAKVDATGDALGELRIKSERFQLNFGHNFQGVNVWLGAQYMEEESRQVGELDGFTYDVLIQKIGWTPKAGMNTVMGEHWELTVEGGFGDMTSALFLLGYRL